MEVHDDPVEDVAREIQLRGLSVAAMLFFDPQLHDLLGGGSKQMQRVLADDNGIERLIERLEEFDEDPGCDA